MKTDATSSQTDLTTPETKGKSDFSNTLKVFNLQRSSISIIFYHYF